MSVWLVKPTIGMSGYASATSSGLDPRRCRRSRAPAPSIVSAVTRWWPGRSPSSFPGRRGRPHTSRIVATASDSPPATERAAACERRRARSRADPRRARTSRRTRARGRRGAAAAPRGARLLQGLVHVAGRLVPGGARKPRRLRAAAREGRPPARGATRCRSPRLDVARPASTVAALAARAAGDLPTRSARPSRGRG